ncbi:MAG: hydroxymethylglutaryl-CoA synthase, partial [Endozoicomonadaceae bacterium]|nr:hydroxymethylglutaryl-CoA synthase [Endozoicomonadaceae bacterium]
MLIGIDDLNFYVPSFYLPLATLAKQKGELPEKYHHGLGQRHMAIPSLDEDIVTMAANAA